MYQLDDDSYLFPPVSEAMREPNGLLAIGGDLSSKGCKLLIMMVSFLGLILERCLYGGLQTLEPYSWLVNSILAGQ